MSKSDEGEEKASMVCERGRSPQLVGGTVYNVKRERETFEVRSSGILGCAHDCLCILLCVAALKFGLEIEIDFS
jgi:hypothetical protein